MSWTWQDASGDTRGLGPEADAYIHWAACGGMAHLWPEGAERQRWVTFLVQWRDGVRWTDAVNTLRAEQSADGSVLITTLPKNLDSSLRFPYAVLSVRLSAGRAGARGIEDDRDRITRLAARLLGDLGAQRLELSLPMRERHAHPLATPDADPEATLESLPADDDGGPQPDADGCYRVLGVIDDVIPFGHPRFKPHVHAVWLQGEDLGGRVSEVALQRGRARQPDERTLRPERGPSSDLEGDLALPRRRHLLPVHLDAEALHQKAIELGFCGVRRRESHGAHVIGLALNPRDLRTRLDGTPQQEQVPTGPASPALVGVQLPWHAVQDTSGRWLGGHILAGLIYALDCTWWLPGRRPAKDDGFRKDAERARHLVANISYGHTTGPHDGTSLLEQAMDALCDHFADSRPAEGKPGIRLDICLAAGNAFDAQVHAAFALGPNAGPQTLTWRVLPDGQRPAFLELWLAGAGRDAPAGVFGLSVQPPAGPPLSLNIAADGCGQWRLADGAAHTQVAFVRVCPVGGQRLVLLALEPTALDRGGPAAPAGDWTLSVDNLGTSALTAHAYVARSTPHLYSRRDGTISYLVDAGYDPERYLRSREDDAAGQQVLRRGTLSGIATGRHSWAATGILQRAREGGQQPSLAHAPYASAGPSAGRPARGPDVAFITDHSRGLPGVLSCGNQGAGQVRLVGTSSAAPQWARELLRAPVAPRQPAAGGSPETALLGAQQR